MSIKSSAFALLLMMGAIAHAAEPAGGNTDQCLSCHDFGPESPVHAVMAGPHGDEMKDGEGCESCHGDSGNHANSPTRVSPGVSFGPHWTASTFDQDQACLHCHEDDVAAHWKDALHMQNDLTCVTCHDVHQEQDKVMLSDTEAEVCTVCHKNQKQGIHGIEEDLPDNPACSSCHNSHNHHSAVTEMLGNRSEGCRTCHDLVQLANTGASSAKAQSYHKVMAQQDRTCLDCHQGISHAPANSVAPMVPEAATRRVVTLFFPGQSDSEWLLTAHPGSQPLRQGHNCQQCHRGDEAAMGDVLAEGVTPASRDVTVAFSRSKGKLMMDLSWAGPPTDQAISVMWGDRDNRIFQRGGCFAACHNDMAGMSRDRGQQTGKYLQASRVQQAAVGRPALVKNQQQLAALRAAGQFVEAWRVALGDGAKTVETASLLEKLEWQADDRLGLSARHENGLWKLRITRPLGALDGLRNFSVEQRFTFGIALNGADTPGGKHWVSLPMTMGLDAEHTDFRAE